MIRTVSVYCRRTARPSRGEYTARSPIGERTVSAGEWAGRMGGAFPAVCRLRGGPSPLLGREPGDVDHACGNDLDTDAEKQERRQAGDDPNPFLSDESSKPVGVTVAE